MDLDAERVFFLGKNGQGKTNLLESLGFVTALRAFRARENEVLIGPKAGAAEIVYQVLHEKDDEVEARLLVKRRGKEVRVDGDPVRKASEFVGRFPSVVLSSEDLALVRGSPGDRRRFLDTFLCGVDREYYVALQRYQKCLKERNALLKQEAGTDLLRPFEVQLVEAGLRVVATRSRVLGDLAELAATFYETLSGANERLAIEYRPNLYPDDEDGYWEVLEQSRRRDSFLQSTGRGPHRDDFEILLDGKTAADYASDGQQRCVVLALAVATIAYWRREFSVNPVLLIDDVLGELDGERRERFWSALGQDIQIIATGTEMPPFSRREDWRVYDVVGGCFTLRESQ